MSSDLPYTPVRKRSVAFAGRQTSVSLEEPFWQRLKRIAADRQIPVAELILEIDRTRDQPNLSSALRLYVLRQATGE